MTASESRTEAGQEIVLQRLARKVNRYLREAYLEHVGDVPRPHSKPFGGSPEESIGPWPEFIFHGFPCPRSAAGLCSPCGYSNVDPVPQERAQVFRSLLAQTDVVVSDLERRMESPRAQDGRVRFALSTIGSFFNEFELSSECRSEILGRLVALQHRWEGRLSVFLEAHAADVLSCHTRGELAELQPALRSLNATVVVGLESADDFVRNCLYVKALGISTFEEAVAVLLSYGLPVGAFVFAGVHSLTEQETVGDVRATLDYVCRRGILPVLMIANVKVFTLDHLLVWLGRHRTLDPRSIVDLFRLLLDRVGDSVDHLPWLAADPAGGPPPPVEDPFRTERKATCDTCAETILRSVRALRRDYDRQVFESTLRPVDECVCAQSYARRLVSEATRAGRIDRIKRAEDNLRAADLAKERYVREIGGG